MRQYAVLLALAVLLTVVGTIYVTNVIAGAMDNMANTIAQAK